MAYLMIGGTLGVCSVACLWRWRSWTTKKSVPQDANSEIGRKLRFIRDVCDDSLKKTNALLMDKMALDSTLSYEQAVDLVYADMLELTADERDAIAKYNSRRVA